MSGGSGRGRLSELWGGITTAGGQVRKKKASSVRSGGDYAKRRKGGVISEGKRRTAQKNMRKLESARHGGGDK